MPAEKSVGGTCEEEGDGSLPEDLELLPPREIAHLLVDQVSQLATINGSLAVVQISSLMAGSESFRHLRAARSVSECASSNVQHIRGVDVPGAFASGIVD